MTINKEGLRKLAPNWSKVEVTPRKEKEGAEFFAEAVINAIQWDQREPTEWESHLLRSALESIRGRAYTLSVKQSLRALDHPGTITDPRPGDIHHATIAQLRKMLTEVRCLRPQAENQ